LALTWMIVSQHSSSTLPWHTPNTSGKGRPRSATLVDDA